MYTRTYIKNKVCPLGKACAGYAWREVHGRTLEGRERKTQGIHCFGRCLFGFYGEHNSKIRKGSGRDVTWRGLVVTWRLIRDWSYLLTFRPLYGAAASRDRGLRAQRIYSLLHSECDLSNLEIESIIKFSTSFLPRSVEKRAIGLRFENEIEWHCKCNRLYIYILYTLESLFLL